MTAFTSSLAAWLREQPGLLSLQYIASLICKAADALQKLHEQEIIYWEVNPFHLLLTVDGTRPEPMSVHLAAIDPSQRVSISAGRSYRSNSMLLYMAPEQWSGHGTAASDQYALAIIAFELLTGQAPFQGPPVDLMEAHLQTRAPAPSTRHLRVPAGVDVVILQALAKRPEDRFPSISAFGHALEQAVLHPGSVIVSVPQITVDGVLRSTLTISQAEALYGTLRKITLPDGRSIAVSIPPGTQHGQVVRLEGTGNLSSSVVPILMTIAISPQYRADRNQRPAVNIADEETIASASSSLPSNTTLHQAPRLLKSATTIMLYSGRVTRKISTSIARFSIRQRIIIFGSAVLLLCLLLGSLSVLLQPTLVSLPYPPHSGVLALDDSLNANTKSSLWPDATGTGKDFCHFVQGAYHISTNQRGFSHYCIASTGNFSNFVFQATMTILQGGQGGLIFRANGNNHTFYYFRIGRDGSYGLYLYNTTQSVSTLVNGLAPAIRTGPGIANLLAIVAQGNTFALYVNGESIATVNNNAFDTGQIGLAASFDTTTSEVMFANARLWTI